MGAHYDAAGVAVARSLLSSMASVSRSTKYSSRPPSRNLDPDPALRAQPAHPGIPGSIGELEGEQSYNTARLADSYLNSREAAAQLLPSRGKSLTGGPAFAPAGHSLRRTVTRTTPRPRTDAAAHAGRDGDVDPAPLNVQYVPEGEDVFCEKRMEFGEG